MAGPGFRPPLGAALGTPRDGVHTGQEGWKPQFPRRGVCHSWATWRQVRRSSSRRHKQTHRILPLTDVPSIGTSDNENSPPQTTAPGTEKGANTKASRARLVGL